MGTVELSTGWRITKLAGSTCLSGILAGVVYPCALIFSTAGPESQAGLTGGLEVHHRPLLRKHRCSACQAHEAKQGLVW